MMMTMISKQKLWEIKEYDKEKAGGLAAELGISPLVTGILLERGFETVEEMHEFLFGSVKPFHDPFKMKGIKETVDRIEQALANGERITVYGDYDVDGITASSLLYLYLKSRGAKVSTYIPKRKSEGYGLNDEALKTIFEEGTTLVITVDCGISGVHEVENAPQGMDIIITDHHTVPVELPPAYAIVNTKQSDCDYPFKDLSGVGVAFKLCQALEIQRGNFDWCDFTELAALGTVADIVPLKGENRELVKRGLKAIRSTKLIGLQALINASGTCNEDIASDTIGFRLAPRLNAVGRLEHAQSAVELLVTEDPAKAEAIAQELNRENSLRQEIGRQILADAERLLAEQEHVDTCIVLAKEGWHQGVIGIVASKLVDKYHLPTILISIDGENAKGSCRSIPSLNLYEAIASQSEILTQFGGHHQAAGLTLPSANVEAFKQGFRQYVSEHLQPEDYIPRLVVDSLLCPHRELTLEEIDNLSLLEPFGASNSAPVFAFTNAIINNHRAIGNERSHLQFLVQKGDFEYKAIMWNRADLLPVMFEGMLADVAFKPSRNEWNGHVSVQLQMESLRQRLMLWDGRLHNGTKLQFLQKLLRTVDSICLLTNETLPDALEEWYNANKDRVFLASYHELQGALADHAESVIVALTMPDRPIKQVVTSCKENSIQQLVLLYDQDDCQDAVDALDSKYPDRNSMIVEYRNLVAKLKSTSTVLENQLEVSPVALKVFQELGFINISHGLVSMGQVKKSNLEDSPYYAGLRKEKASLYRLYTENMRLSQYELLRCNTTERGRH